MRLSAMAVPLVAPLKMTARVGRAMARLTACGRILMTCLVVDASAEVRELA